MSKLIPIAEKIKTLLEKEFYEKAEYTLECSKHWLVNIPDKKLYNNFWNEISNVYEALIENKWKLDDALNDVSYLHKIMEARIDIWFHKPYSFVCEFDERQHFNQYRLITLKTGYNNLKYSFDYNHYIELSSKRYAKPGKSGFDKLRKRNGLFPEMLKGEKQDNRTRQRAFNDYMKDIVPQKLGYNPTVRISYKITNNKIKDFAEEELINVKQYLYDNKIFDNIHLKNK